MKILLAILLLALSFNAQAGSADGKALWCGGDGLVFEKGRVSVWRLSRSRWGGWAKKGDWAKKRLYKRRYKQTDNRIQWKHPPQHLKAGVPTFLLPYQTWTLDRKTLVLKTSGFENDTACSLSGKAEIFKRLDAIAAGSNKAREEAMRENKL